MTGTDRTAGQALTAELRRYFSIGPRTGRYRRGPYGGDLHVKMIEALTYAATLDGYFAQPYEDLLRPGFGAALAYDKHIRGYRADGTVIAKIGAMTAWEFSALLGAMVDAGVTCTGEGERYFATMRRELAAV